MFARPPIPSSRPPIPPATFVPGDYWGPYPFIPPYNSNNIGSDHIAAENTFRRLQQDALNSPNFALDYVTPGEKLI